MGVPSQPLDSFGYGEGGGAGGGALLIASPSSITVNGTIQANGGGVLSGLGGPGAGGGIRLVAPSIGGGGLLSVNGGSNLACCRTISAAGGLIRLDTFFDSFSHRFNGPFQIGSTMAVFPPTIHPPAITVTAVNGANLPQPPTGGPQPPDAAINTTAPVTVTIQASFIPLGTVLTLFVSSDNNTEQAIQTTPLQGTFESSIATASVTFPSGFSLNYVKATWKQ
jgi:hypothetical protein